MTITASATTPTYKRMAEWVGLGGSKPAPAELAAYLASELDNREDVDAVEAAVIREGVAALAAHDQVATALALGEEVAAATIDVIRKFCDEADDWREAAHKLNDKILEFRRAHSAAEKAQG